MYAGRDVVTINIGDQWNPVVLHFADIRTWDDAMRLKEATELRVQIVEEIFRDIQRGDDNALAHFRSLAKHTSRRRGELHSDYERRLYADHGHALSDTNPNYTLVDKARNDLIQEFVDKIDKTVWLQFGGGDAHTYAAEQTLRDALIKPVLETLGVMKDRTLEAALSGDDTARVSSKEALAFAKAVVRE